MVGGGRWWAFKLDELLMARLSHFVFCGLLHGTKVDEITFEKINRRVTKMDITIPTETGTEFDMGDPDAFLTRSGLVHRLARRLPCRGKEARSTL